MRNICAAVMSDANLKTSCMHCWLCAMPCIPLFAGRRPALVCTCCTAVHLPTVQLYTHTSHYTPRHGQGQGEAGCVCSSRPFGRVSHQPGSCAVNHSSTACTAAHLPCLYRQLAFSSSSSYFVQQGTVSTRHYLACLVQHTVITFWHVTG